MVYRDGDGQEGRGAARGVLETFDLSTATTLPSIKTGDDRGSPPPAVAPADASASQQFVTQPSQTVPAFGAATIPTRNQSSNKRKAASGPAVPDWVHYDADILDNVAKTRRFASECISEDLLSRMSMSEDGNEAVARSCLVPSPSPQSKHSRVMGPCTGPFSTPTKPKRDEYNPMLTHSAVPAKLFEAELTVTTSPSDVLMDGGVELRKTALVRLALRNGRHAYEMDR